MKYRCKKLTDEAWSKAFEIGGEYECLKIVQNGSLEKRELLLRSGQSQFLVPYDCFDLIDKEEEQTEQLAQTELSTTQEESVTESVEYVESIIGTPPTERQVGGSHYKELPIQPIRFILSNDISFCEANVIKYVVRWREKNGVEDLEKAKHYIDILINGERS